MKNRSAQDAPARGTDEIKVPGSGAATTAPSLLISGPGTCREFPLEPGKTYRIGRLTSCEIVLHDGSISRKQAMIQSSETGQFYVVDLGSRNGTFLNGTRISAPAAVNDGDEVLVGEHRLTFRGPSQLPPSSDDTGTGTKVMFVRRMVSVLVADIRGYTAMSRETEPQLLAEAIGTWFRDAGRTLQGYGCWSVKYIGDAIMAVWIHGEQPEPREIARLLEGAAELARRTPSVREQFHLSLPFEAGVGVNTGIAIVGNAGTRTYTDYTAMGEAVNAAFRMESCTRETRLQFAIGPATLKVLEAFCDPSTFLATRTVQMKGYDEPATVWAASLSNVEEFVAALRARLDG